MNYSIDDEDDFSEDTNTKGESKSKRLKTKPRPVAQRGEERRETKMKPERKAKYRKWDLDDDED